MADTQIRENMEKNNTTYEQEKVRIPLYEKFYLSGLFGATHGIWP